MIPTLVLLGFPGGSDGKESAHSVGDPWVGKIPWSGERLPTPVFWPAEFHGQRSLAGYSPWGCRQSDMTEQLSFLGHSKEFGIQPNYNEGPLRV